MAMRNLPIKWTDDMARYIGSIQVPDRFKIVCQNCQQEIGMKRELVISRNEKTGILEIFVDCDCGKILPAFIK